MRVHPLLLVCFVAWCGSAGAQPAERFDLSCTGTQQNEMNREPLGAAKPWKATFHIDLHSRLFCVDDCKMVQDIAEVYPSAISLISEQSMIDRTTGEYISFERLAPTLGIYIKAQCEAGKLTKTPQRF